jgi:hypothetical protein
MFLIIGAVVVLGCVLFLAGLRHRTGDSALGSMSERWLNEQRQSRR